MSYEGPTGQSSAPPKPPGAPPAGGGTVSSNRQVMLVLSYLWLLALVPLLSEKEDKEVQWHAKHGLVLFGAEIVVWVVLRIIFHAVLIATLGFGCILALFFPLLSLAFLALHIFCIIKALNGQRLIIPGLSGLADKF